MRSFVLSRLTFNIHVCVVSPRVSQKLAGVYMRVLRRIAGDPRFSTKVEMTDSEVRIKLQMPPLDCILMVARFRYFARLVRNQPRPLLSLLHVGSSEPELFRMSIRTDTERIRAAGLVPDLGAVQESHD